MFIVSMLYNIRRQTNFFFSRLKRIITPVVRSRFQSGIIKSIQLFFSASIHGGGLVKRVPSLDFVHNFRYTNSRRLTGNDVLALQGLAHPDEVRRGGSGSFLYKRTTRNNVPGFRGLTPSERCRRSGVLFFHPRVHTCICRFKERI